MYILECICVGAAEQAAAQRAACYMHSMKHDACDKT